MNVTRRIVFLCICICFIVVAHAWAKIPKKQNKLVSDFAGILSDKVETRINRLLDSTEKSTGAEIAVVTVRSLDGMSVEEYAVRLFNKWGIGKKGEDNGVLFLVAPNERQMRIEVGYGLEPVITDGRAGYIRDSVLRFFRAGDYDEGILQGSIHIASLVTGKEPVPIPTPKVMPQAASDTPWPMKVFIILFFALFITLGFVTLGYGMRQKGQRFFLVWGTGFGGIPLFMSIIFGMTIGFPIYILPIWAFLSLITGIFYGKKIIPGTMSSGGSFSMGGRTYSGSSFSGFSGGSSFGGFGGGSSGGGGASGSW
jgi:uncharacterized protein